MTHFIQRGGVPTTSISLIREHSEAIGPTRALWVPFPLGRPWGVPEDPDFQRVVYDERLTERSFVHGNLEAGDYYWRVFQQRGPMFSLPAPTRRLTVQRDAVEPPLTVQLPEGTVNEKRIRVRGSTEPSCRVLIGDVAVPVAADGSFEHELTLQHGYNFLVVQAVDPAGNAAFLNQTILADLASPKRAP